MVEIIEIILGCKKESGRYAFNLRRVRKTAMLAVQHILGCFWQLSMYTLCCALGNAFLFSHHKCRLHHTVHLLPSDYMYLWLGAFRLVCFCCHWFLFNQYENLNCYLNICSIKFIG